VVFSTFSLDVCYPSQHRAAFCAFAGRFHAALCRVRFVLLLEMSGSQW